MVQLRSFNKPLKTIADLGEFGFIQKYLSQLSCVKSGKKYCAIPLGDDACSIPIAKHTYLFLSKDLLFEDRHFLTKPPYHFQALGYKSVTVNVSDLAAMGVAPQFILLGLGLPKDTALKDINHFLKGVNLAAKKYGVHLLGGDTNQFSKWVISITVLGLANHQGISRQGAHPGDTVWVTGTLGGSALGLAALLKNRKEPCFKPVIERHLYPQARVREGMLLQKSGMLSAMLDVSDGLASDVTRLAEKSKVGFEIHVAKIAPIKNFKSLCSKIKAKPLEFIVNSGEEYELLFTVKKSYTSFFINFLRKNKIDATCIGQATARKGIRYFDEQGLSLSIKPSVHHF